MINAGSQTHTVTTHLCLVGMYSKSAEENFSHQRCVIPMTGVTVTPLLVLRVQGTTFNEMSVSEVSDLCL